MKLVEKETSRLMMMYFKTAATTPKQYIRLLQPVKAFHSSQVHFVVNEDSYKRSVLLLSLVEVCRPFPVVLECTKIFYSAACHEGNRNI